VYESGDIKKIREMSHAIEYNIGAHFNYEFFWESLAPVNVDEETNGEGDGEEDEGIDLVVINEKGEETTIRVEEG